jgi:hippurate hydrolase
MDDLLQEARGMRGDLIEWRRYLHQNPELEMQLPVTSAFVREKLESMGYEVRCVLGSGITALAGGKRPGKCMMLRADMDALPLLEQTDVGFKSVNGNMHACGHDLHTTMLLGAARLLKAHEDEIEGRVKLVFQPAEETMTGARAMLEAGILEAPKVDAAAMIHVIPGTPLPSGTIIVPNGGPFSAASDWFEIAVRGKGGHGAMPEGAVDPLNVMSHIHLALQAIISREISATETAVLTVGQMQGGEKPNVIPDTALMKGTIRTFKPELRQFIITRMTDIANQTAMAFRASADPRVVVGCPSVIIDAKVAKDVRQSLTDTFGKDMVPDPSVMGRMSASEDFGYFSEKVPSLTMLLSAGSTDEGYSNPLHHPKAKFNEEVLPLGAAAYAISAIGWLGKNA